MFVLLKPRHLFIVPIVIGCAEPIAPDIELGTGEYEYESLNDASEIDIVYGPQGGYHLLGSIRIKGIAAGNWEDLTDPTNPTTRFEIIVENQQLVMSSPFTQGYDPVIEQTDWTHEMVGRLAIMDIEDDDDYDNVMCVFRAVVTDSEGREWRDEKNLRLIPSVYN